MNDFTWRPSWAKVLPESSLHPHIPEERADRFFAADGGSTEYEVLNWIHATIRALKPDLVLETGGFKGLGTVALAHACSLNGFGRVVCLEHDANCCAQIEESLEASNLRDWAEVHWANSTEFLANYDHVYDIAFFDSEISVRAIECGILLERGRLRKVGVFHDTSEGRSGGPEQQAEQMRYRQQIHRLAAHPSCSGLYDSKLSRGFMALFIDQ